MSVVHLSASELAIVAAHASGSDDPEALLVVLAQANAAAFRSRYEEAAEAPSAAEIAAALAPANSTPDDAARVMLSLHYNTEDLTEAQGAAFGELGRAVLVEAAAAGLETERARRLFDRLAAMGQGPKVSIVFVYIGKAEPPALAPATTGELDVDLLGVGLDSGRTERRARVVPGVSVALYGTVGASYGSVAEYLPTGERRLRSVSVPARRYVRTFLVGQEASHGSYNLEYTGSVTKVGPKTVEITDGGTRRLKLAEFDRRNWDFDPAETARRNAREFECV